jgi:hypothetical protein
VSDWKFKIGEVNIGDYTLAVGYVAARADSDRLYFKLYGQNRVLIRSSWLNAVYSDAPYASDWINVSRQTREEIKRQALRLDALRVFA